MAGDWGACIEGRKKNLVLRIISTFLLLLGSFLCWHIILSQLFFWKTFRGPVGTLSAACGVHVTLVERVMATESRRNWL